MEAPKSVYERGYICLGCMYQVKRVGFGAFWHVYLLLPFTRWQFLINMFVIILSPQDFNSLQKHANVQYDCQSSYKTRGAQPGRLKSPRIPGNASAKQSSPRSADRTSSKSSSRTSTQHSVTGSSSSSSPKWQSLSSLQLTSADVTTKRQLVEYSVLPCFVFSRPFSFVVVAYFVCNLSVTMSRLTSLKELICYYEISRLI